MRIKTILRIIKEIKYLKSVLKCYGDSLEKGKYHLFNSFRAMSIDRDESRKTAFEYFNRKSVNPRMANVADKLNSIKFFRNKRRNSTEEYEAIYIANNYDAKREVKLFSFKNEKIMTICTDSKVAEGQMSQYEKYKDSYNMPEVCLSSRYPDSFEIAMVKLMPFSGDLEALTEIVCSVTDYNKSVQSLSKASVSDLLSFSYENSDINAWLEKLTVKVDETLHNTEIPLCLQHGDLSKDNLIYGRCKDKVGFWWIDWEHARDRVFFYDYFFYIINSALYDDFGAYNTYISGKHDAVLQKWFEHFGLNFSDKNRFDYFLIFAVDFLKERVCDNGNLTALKKYFELIERLQSDCEV